jgi:hypothetical protein
MKKIISLFQRDYDGDRIVRNEVVPGAEWVIAGEGVATRKWDGTCCEILDGKMWKRYDAKHGKTPPPDFRPAQEPDAVTGHWPGWVPVTAMPCDTYHREAYRGHLPDGTYELCGPKINGNPECLSCHILIRHGYWCGVLLGVPRAFDAILKYLRVRDIEGIVWHHPDGRMVKIKKKDFGLSRRGML